MFRPRRKESEGAQPGPLPARHVSITYETLEDLFHLPLKDAAKEVGLCPTTFKKACRRFLLEEWPFQKGQSRVPHRNRAPTGGVLASVQLEKLVCVPATASLQHADQPSQESLNDRTSPHGWWEASVFVSSFSSNTTTVPAFSRRNSDAEGCRTSEAFDPHASVSHAPDAQFFDIGSFFAPGAGGVTSCADAVMDYLEGRIASNSSSSLTESFEFEGWHEPSSDDDFARAATCPHAAPADAFHPRAASCPHVFCPPPPSNEHEPASPPYHDAPFRRASTCAAPPLPTWTEGEDEGGASLCESDGADQLLVRLSLEGAWWSEADAL